MTWISKYMIYTKLTLKKLGDVKAGDKTPSHALVASDSTYQNKVTVGKMWLKVGEFGNYLSGELNASNRTYPKKDGTKGEEKAYVIITRDEYDQLKQAHGSETVDMKQVGNNIASSMPKYDQELDPNDIPW